MVAGKAKFLLEYLLERYHAGYVSPDKALAQMLHADCRCANLLTLCPVTGGFAGVAQLVEHLICNQRVGGSSPFASSVRVLKRAGVVEWLMAPGCKPGGFTPYVGSNPTPCTTKR